MKAAEHYCCEPGCSEKVLRGRCPTHSKAQKQHYQRHVTGTFRLNYGRQWKRERLRYLADHPYCVQCPPETHTFATQLDHIIPHRNIGVLFWDPTNWQGLCDTHHARKTAAEVRLGIRDNRRDV